jgi:hypothetical protein
MCVCAAGTVPGAVPWRLAAADYLDTVAAGATSGPQLSGRGVTAPWDPELAIALADRAPGSPKRTGGTA